MFTSSIIAFTQFVSLPHNFHHNTNRKPPQCSLSKLPSTFSDMRSEATTSALSAVKAREKLVELQFPAVPNLNTAALNELLDANLKYARQLLGAFVPRIPKGQLHVVLADEGEARMAKRIWGEELPFQVWALPRKQTPSFIKNMTSDGVAIVVQPGFNVSEWINMELLQGEGSIVTVNADFDKLRGGYYPRIFYPGLWKVKERFLTKFEECYYVKMLSNGGTLIKRYGQDWILFYAAKEGYEVLWKGEQRPQFPFVEGLLRERLERERTGV